MLKTNIPVATSGTFYCGVRIEAHLCLSYQIGHGACHSKRVFCLSCQLLIFWIIPLRLRTVIPKRTISTITPKRYFDCDSKTFDIPNGYFDCHSKRAILFVIPKGPCLLSPQKDRLFVISKGLFWLSWWQQKTNLDCHFKRIHVDPKKIIFQSKLKNYFDYQKDNINMLTHLKRVILYVIPKELYCISYQNGIFISHAKHSILSVFQPGKLNVM